MSFHFTATLNVLRDKFQLGQQQGNTKKYSDLYGKLELARQLNSGKHSSVRAYDETINFIGACLSVRQFLDRRLDHFFAN